MHTGIVRCENTIDEDELNLANKKYVNDGLKLKLDKAGDDMSGPFGMNGGKIWDFASGTLVRFGSATVNAHQNKLLSTYISNAVEKHFHLSYSGQATGFSITGGKAVFVWGGFNSIDGRCVYASIKLRGMGWRPFSKIQLFASDNTSGLSFASTPITNALTGSYLNGTYVIAIGTHLHFNNMTYLAVYFEGDTRKTTMYFDLYVDLAIE